MFDEVSRRVNKLGWWLLKRLGGWYLRKCLLSLELDTGGRFFLRKMGRRIGFLLKSRLLSRVPQGKLKLGRSEVDA